MEPVVHLSPGSSIRGKVTHLENDATPVHAYLGVPFAEPPTGKLRLQKPAPKQPWTGERDCTKNGPAPPQSMMLIQAAIDQVGLHGPQTFSEDCLHLSIYTPAKRSSEKLPVMVWIYGGGFIIGFTDCYIGTAFAALQDVVFVALTYRVGALGFFSTGDETCLGNFGLWDQVEGLKWIQQHISKFGGDPQNVTLFGESAGGISVSLHHTMPASRGLFHKSIHMSGVANLQGDQPTQEECRDATKDAGKMLGLAEDCTPSDVHAAIMKLPEAEFPTKLPMLRVRPVIDNDIIKDDGYQLYKRGEFIKTHSMFTMTSHEGYIYRMFGPVAEMPLTNKPECEALLKAAVDFQKVHHIKDVSGFVSAMMREYIPSGDITPDELKLRVFDIMTDMHFYSAIDAFARLHTDAVPEGTYFGIFNHKLSLTTHIPGIKADHADDVPVMLGIPLMTPEDRRHKDWSDEEKTIAKQMLAYFSNFARTGNPNGRGLATWPGYTPDSLNHLIMEEECRGEKGPYKPSRQHFWATVPDKF